MLIESGINYVEVANEAAFYGPKIDVQVWSAIGREFTIATNRVDFAVPAKFGLTYRDKDNSNKTPLCIHRAPLGTHERFIGFLIEHYAGNFPLRLAPDQVRVITLNDDEALINYAKSIVAELRANMVRVDSDFSATPFKAKISNAEQLRVHTMLVIGGRDMEASAVSVRLHHGGPQRLPSATCTQACNNVFYGHEHDLSERFAEEARETMAQVGGQGRLGGHVQGPARCGAVAHRVGLVGIYPGTLAQRARVAGTGESAASRRHQRRSRIFHGRH